MLEIVWVTLPFFALVLAGFVAVRWGWLAAEAIPGLNSFVLFFALPCMLFRFGASTPITQLLNGELFFIYLLCAAVMVTSMVVYGLRRGLGWNDAALGALVASFPNTGFMGVPLLVALLGAASAGPAIVSICVDLLFTSSLCVALSRLDGAGQQGVRRAAGQSLKGVLSNPMPWAVCAGAVFSANLWSLPEPVFRTVGLLADAASPVALFTIGAVLARSSMQSAGQLAGVQVGAACRVSVWPGVWVKLLVHPVLVLLVGSTAVQWGLPLDRFALHVVVLVAALPSASNVSMLAERLGANNGRIAQIILLTTLLAFVTFTAAVALVTV